MAEPKEDLEVYRKKGVRLNAEMSPLVNKYLYSTSQGLMYRGFHMLDKAHTVMLTEQGIVPRATGVAILKALRQMEKEGVAEVRERLGGHQHCGEVYVTRLLGPDIGGWMNCARSSGDLNAVGWRVEARDGIARIGKELIALRRTFLKKADEHINTVMPGYTQLQHGEPLTLGFYLLSYVHHFERDFERFRVAYKHTNISPAGCGVLSTSDFPIDRVRLQKLLGFDDLFTNARDGIWNFDYLFELFTTIANLSSILTRLADDLTIWHSSEFGMVEHPDAYCGTSSIMPQKKNPYGTQCVRGLGGNINGALISFLTIMKTQSDAVELATMAPPLLPEMVEKCIAMIQIISGVVQDMKVNRELMRQRAGMFWAQATSLANAIVRETGLPFRSAHQIVGTLVRMAYEQGKRPEDVTPEMVDRAAIEFNGKPLNLSEAVLRKALDPALIVESKEAIGGTASVRVREDIIYSLDKAAADERTIAGWARKLAASDRALEKAVDAILSGEKR